MHSIKESKFFVAFDTLLSQVKTIERGFKKKKIILVQMSKLKVICDLEAVTEGIIVLLINSNLKTECLPYIK